jgi:regulatory protein
VLGALEHRGLLDDRRFTEMYIESRQHRGFGPLRIRAELRERGISERLIGEQLAEDPDVWAELLRRAHDKKYGRDRASDAREQARRMRFLQYRGFSPELIRGFLFGEE